MYHRIWRPLFVLVAGMFPAATAQICNSPNGSYFFIENQPQLDSLAGACTTLNASVNILPPYDGPFYLPNIRNISGTISYKKMYDASRSVPTPSSIDLPDLEFCESVYLHSLPSLRNVSMSKLRTVDWNLDVDNAPEIDFRAVQTAEYASFTGEDLARVRLDSLREVRQRLFLCNKNACNESITASKPFDISLPRLESVGSIGLGGRISSLDMPEFTKVSGNGGEYYGFWLDTQGGPTVNLTFPQLRGVYSFMSLTGEIGNLSMPNFKNTTQSWLTINASASALDINLPIEHADEIQLYGNISSVQLPNLEHVDSLGINSKLDMNCDSTIETIATALNRTVGPADGLSCTSTHKPTGGLSKGAKIAIGVVVGIVGLGAILGGLLFLRKRRPKK